MKRRAILAAACAACVATAGCGKAVATRPAGKVRVVATIFPLADVVREIGGPDVTVTCLLRPGESEHDFDPRAELAEAVAKAQLLVMVGMGMDEWARRIGSAAAGRALVLELAEQPEFKKMLATRPAEETPPSRPAGSPDQGGGHEHAGGDPHVWLDPVYMQQFARQIADALCRLDPPHAGLYRQRLDAYLAQLRALDQEYRQGLAGVKNRNFVTFHAAFGHLAARYGLRQQALQGADAADFGPGQLEEVIAFIRQHQVKAIFAEPQFPADRLQMLAERTGTKVGQLDPLGSPLAKGYDSYLAMMRSNLQALVAGLNQ
jgi:zinc transport system substrate-binding protein